MNNPFSSTAGDVPIHVANNGAACDFQPPKGEDRVKKICKGTYTSRARAHTTVRGIYVRKERVEFNWSHLRILLSLNLAKVMGELFYRVNCFDPVWSLSTKV